MVESHKRTLVRAMTYRVIALLITAAWTGISSAILIHIILTAVHYIHERLWININWGKQ